jgi:hypothetical protein
MAAKQPAGGPPAVAPRSLIQTVPVPPKKTKVKVNSAYGDKQLAHYWTTHEPSKKNKDNLALWAAGNWASQTQGRPKSVFQDALRSDNIANLASSVVNEVNNRNTRVNHVGTGVDEDGNRVYHFEKVLTDKDIEKELEKNASPPTHPIQRAQDLAKIPGQLQSGLGTVAVGDAGQPALQRTMKLRVVTMVDKDGSHIVKSAYPVL